MEIIFWLVIGSIFFVSGVKSSSHIGSGKVDVASYSQYMANAVRGRDIFSGSPKSLRLTLLKWFLKCFWFPNNFFKTWIKRKWCYKTMTVILWIIIAAIAFMKVTDCIPFVQAKGPSQKQTEVGIPTSVCFLYSRKIMRIIIIALRLPWLSNS